MRKLIAVLFTLCLVFPLLLASQTAISAASWALNEQFYIDALDNEDVYQALLSDEILDGILRSRLALPAEADTSELREILRSILDSAYLKEQTTAFVADLFDYLHGETTEFNPTLDLKPVKAALGGDKQAEFMAALVEILPVCQAGQTPGIGGEGQSACKPEGIPDEVLIENYIQPVLLPALEQIPDEVTLGQNWQRWQSQQPWRRFLPGMAVPASLVLTVLSLAFLAVCAWYLTALISSANWRARLQWLGWMLLIPSGFVFLLGALLQGNTALYWLNYGMQRADFRFNASLSGLSVIIEALSASALPRISTSFLMVGGICGGLALGLIVWGLATPKKN